MKSVLIVDDEKYIRNILSKILKDRGFKIYCAEDGYHALQLYSEFKQDVVILDFKLPDIDGIEVLSRLKTINPNATNMSAPLYCITLNKNPNANIIKANVPTVKSSFFIQRYFLFHLLIIQYK